MTESWQSRIVGSDRVAPESLLANPFNWRVHPKFQQEAVEESLDTLGWIQQPVVNRRTGHVIDGHLRVQVAIRRGESEIPVLVVDLSEEEERQALASIDPLASLAVMDTDMLASVLDGLSPAAPTLTEFFDQLRGDAAQGPSGPGEERQQVPARVSLRALIAVADLTLLEEALGATGKTHRGEALLVLCRSYLERASETGQHGAAAQGEPALHAAQAHT